MNEIVECSAVNECSGLERISIINIECELRVAAGVRVLNCNQLGTRRRGQN